MRHSLKVSRAALVVYAVLFVASDSTPGRGSSEEGLTPGLRGVSGSSDDILAPGLQAVSGSSPEGHSGVAGYTLLKSNLHLILNSLELECKIYVLKFLAESYNFLPGMMQSSGKTPLQNSFWPGVACSLPL